MRNNQWDAFSDVRTDIRPVGLNAPIFVNARIEWNRIQREILREQNRILIRLNEIV